MRIGVIRYWADRPAAEHEVIARLTAAAKARGHQLVELNPDNTSLQHSSVTPTVDFVLNLHFASPKSCDVPHVGALWNPLDFYYRFGYVPHFANQLSHDFLATCGSRVVEDVFAPFRPDLFKNGLPLLNHTVPERYISPATTRDRRVFYVGVNWDRTPGGGGRHGDLLYLLDAADVMNIYGPRLVDGVAPWDGYQSYQGDLAFDGMSVIRAISDSGAALIVSSPAHYRDLVMSSRPFEAAAAGVPMISERHPFMLEHFADAALFFDERAPADLRAKEIIAHLKHLNEHPDEAVALATRAQEILREKFNLDQQLDELCAWVTEQTAETQPEIVDATAVVVPVTTSAQFGDWVQANRAVLERFAHVYVVPPDRDDSWRQAVAGAQLRAQIEVPTRSDTGWSERAALVGREIDGTVCFLTATEDLYGSYPQAVVDAVSGSESGLVPAVIMPAPMLDANARLPRLICGSVSDWWAFPIASLVTTGRRLRDVGSLFGPGTHTGVLVAEAIATDAKLPRFVPAVSIMEVNAGVGSVGALAGEERHRDAQYARSLPTHLVTSLPKAILQPEQSLPQQLPLHRKIAGAIRRSPLVPARVSDVTAKVGRKLLQRRLRGRV